MGMVEHHRYGVKHTMLFSEVIPMLATVTRFYPLLPYSPICSTFVAAFLSILVYNYCI